MDMMSIPFQLTAAWPTGSSYTCDPPVRTTDEDWLLLTAQSSSLDKLEELLAQDGWSRCAEADEELYRLDPDYGKTWTALRKGHYNIMVTEDVSWYMRACAATELCKRMNVQLKDNRKMLFRCVRDGADYDALALRPLGWDCVP